VAYTVPDSDMVSFTDAMQVIEARRRTGAYQWVVSRSGRTEPLRRDLPSTRGLRIYASTSASPHFDQQWETVRKYCV
jgi:hypothetical protein